MLVRPGPAVLRHAPRDGRPGAAAEADTGGGGEDDDADSAKALEMQMKPARACSRGRVLAAVVFIPSVVALVRMGMHTSSAQGPLVEPAPRAAEPAVATTTRGVGGPGLRGEGPRLGGDAAGPHGAAAAAGGGGPGGGGSGGGGSTDDGPGSHGEKAALDQSASGAAAGDEGSDSHGPRPRGGGGAKQDTAEPPHDADKDQQQDHRAATLGAKAPSTFNEVDTARIPAEPWQRPRLLYMGGCSQSSFIVRLAKGLLELHGIQPYEADPEMINPIKNAFYVQGVPIGKAMMAMHRDAVSRNRTIIIKKKLFDKFWHDALPALLQLGTYLVYSFRGNFLDTATCNVKDCFSNCGHGVVGDGVKSKLCFKRRKVDSTDYKAFFYRDKLVKCLRALNKSAVDAQVMLRQRFPNFITVVGEDLVDFEYGGPGALDRSTDAWERFLTSWGVRPNRAAVVEHLRKFEGTRTLAPQKKSIYNMDDVQATLSGIPELARLVRS